MGPGPNFVLLLSSRTVMRTLGQEQGSDFLEKNAALGEEVRRTFADLDRVECELKKAAEAIGAATGLVGKYRGRLQSLCDNTGAQKKMPKRQQEDGSGIPQTAGV